MIQNHKTEEALSLVYGERIRQVHIFGYTQDHDDVYCKDVIAALDENTILVRLAQSRLNRLPDADDRDRLNLLTQSCALLIAEIERIRRQQVKQQFVKRNEEIQALTAGCEKKS